MSFTNAKSTHDEPMFEHKQFNNFDNDESKYIF